MQESSTPHNGSPFDHKPNQVGNLWSLKHPSRQPCPILRRNGSGGTLVGVIRSIHRARLDQGSGKVAQTGSIGRDWADTKQVEWPVMAPAICGRAEDRFPM